MQKYYVPIQQDILGMIVIQNDKNHKDKKKTVIEILPRIFHLIIESVNTILMNYVFFFQLRSLLGLPNNNRKVLILDT